MRIKLWVPGENLGELSAERVDEMRGDVAGPIVAVLDDDDGVMIFQPVDPQTGEAWQSEDEALAFAYRYMTAAPIPAPTEE